VGGAGGGAGVGVELMQKGDIVVGGTRTHVIVVIVGVDKVGCGWMLALVLVVGRSVASACTQLVEANTPAHCIHLNGWLS